MVRYIHLQIECRNRRGSQSDGRKVTGIEFSSEGKLLLVTTNDSRVRLFEVPSFSSKAKLKGLQNDDLQIKAHFSPDGQHIVCGSQTGHVYLWDTQQIKGTSFLGKATNKNDSYESFRAEKNTCTSALMVPPAAVRHSSGTETPPDCLLVTTGWEGGIKFFESRKTDPQKERKR